MKRAKAAAAYAAIVAAAATLPQSGGPLPDPARKGIAESTIRPSTVKAVGALDAALAAKIYTAVSAKAYSKTERTSQDPAMASGTDIPEAGGLLVGFEFYEVGRDKRIRSLRPYFMTKDGIVAGRDRGIMEKVTSKVIARTGYAVAGFLGSDGKNGMQVIFMKIDPTTGRLATERAAPIRARGSVTKGGEAAADRRRRAARNRRLWQDGCGLR